MTEFQRKAQRSESRSAFQRLYGRLLYSAFEFVLWISWFQKRCLICGQLPDAPFVLISNHSSYLDWLFLDVILRRKFRRKITFLAKRKVAQNPVWGALARERSAVVVDEQAKLKAIVLALGVFQNSDPESKQIVAIFPEGTRSRTGKQIPSSGGAALVARKCGALVVPVALCGFWEAWPPERLLPRFRRQKLAVHFLNPINPSDFTDDQTTVDCAMNRVYEIVRRERAARLHTNGD
jgi:1-acyl-sn-glycerol-3-phosphate acyltransferase